MAKELPYFKFYVSEWILGRISSKSDKIQGAFILAICYYWHSNCNYLASDFKLKLGKKRFDLLLNENFIEIKNDYIYIPFLHEQFNELSDIHKKRVKSGQAGGIANAKAKEVAKVKHLDKEEDKDKEEDVEEDKDKEKKNNIDARKLKFASTLKPFLEKYGKELLNDFYHYWTEPNKSNTKFRQELEKTWNLERRLNTWASNEKQFKKSGNGKFTTKSEQQEKREQATQDAIKRVQEQLGNLGG